MLGSWSAIQTALARYTVRERGADWIKFEWPAGAPATMIFQVNFAVIQNRGRLFIGIDVMDDDPAVAHTALIMNSELLVGRLLVLKKNLMLMSTLTVGGFSEDELHEDLASMAHSAELARKRLAP